MRTKAVPDDSIIKKGEKVVGGLFKDKWVLYGGIGLGALAVFLYLQSQNANAAGGGQTGIVPGSPVDYGVTGTSAPVSTNGGSSDNSALLAAIQAQTANDQATQQANLAAITAQANAAIAADQTNLDMASIAGQVSNYANSTNVLDTFLKGVGPGVLGFGGSVTPTGYGGVNVGLFADTQNNPLAWGNVLHSIAGPTNPANNPVLNGIPHAPLINNPGTIPLPPPNTSTGH